MRSLLVDFFLLLLLSSAMHSAAPCKEGPARDTVSATVRMVAVGDINLGRTVGKYIIAGDTCFPFEKIDWIFGGVDIIFGNLESPLSDQGGETQRPRNNLIFTGPSSGADALRMARFTLVSVANNHALDYGTAAFHETLSNLRRAGVEFAGAADSGNNAYLPAVVSRNGISFAFFAVTDIRNSEGPAWREVADADTSLLFPAVRRVRGSVDFVILSYHGGNEYRETPTRRSREFLRAAVDAGVDVVLGHHPHVLQGIERYHRRIVSYSLGNFIFYQPQHKWTQRSVALLLRFEKGPALRRVELAGTIPVRAGYQPEAVDKESPDGREILLHLVKISGSKFPLPQLQPTYTEKQVSP